MRRSNNQDAFSVMISKSADRIETRGHLFVVADGMGAHAAGELASQIASEQIPKHYFGATHQTPENAVVEAVHVANEAIFQRGRSNPEFHNMGTTASTLALLPGAAYIAHVGDSRVYRLRGQTLHQMTFDHSLVWEMHESGQVHSDSPLGRSIPKNVITRSLGPAADVLVDLEGPLDLRPGDQFLLCSDGLTGEVTDEELAVLMGCVEPDALVHVLVDLANLRGGPDNITVVVAEIEGDQLTHPAPGSTAPISISSETMRSRALLATMAVCWLGAVGFTIAALMGEGRFIGSAIVAFVLGAIAAGVWGTGWFKAGTSSRSSRKRGHGGNDSGNAREHARGKAPYRTFDAAPTLEVHDRVWGMVEELRQTAEHKNWMLDWDDVDQWQRQAELAKTQGNLRDAIGLQSRAFSASMLQLRKHQDESASDTVIDL
ncbi:MAG: protein phosphatase 2C domain-containing protein [Planctomycetota bacterium]